ncbi:hypothetical protein SK128_017391, partial [Halocaridina rubra]
GAPPAGAVVVFHTFDYFLSPWKRHSNPLWIWAKKRTEAVATISAFVWPLSPAPLALYDTRILTSARFRYRRAPRGRWAWVEHPWTWAWVLAGEAFTCKDTKSRRR